MKRWIRCVPGFVMLVVFSIFCAQTVMAAETGTTTDPSQEEMIKPEPEIDIIKEPESVYYRVVVDDRIEGAQVECPDQAAAGEIVPVLVRADGDYRIRSVVVNYYDASSEGHQIEMDPLMEDEDGVHYEFIMPDADVAILVMTEVMHNVTVLKSDGGTVTASHDRAGFNDSVALTAEPEEGYRFASWEVYEESGSQIGVRSDDTFLMGFEAVIVCAIFEKLKGDYSITLTQSGEGTIVSSGERANAGETVTVTPSAQSGYRLERITVTANTPGADVVLEDTEEKESYSFTMPEGDVTVHVQFDKITDYASPLIPTFGPQGDDQKPERTVEPEEKEREGYATLSLKQKKVSKTAIKITWKKIPNASYIVYGAACGKGKAYRKLKALSGNTFTKRKLKKGTYYKFYVAAVKNGKVVARSKSVQIATKGGKVGNAKKIILNKKSVKLKRKKKFLIKAKQIPESSKATIHNHRKISFESGNPKVVSVSSKGKVKALKKGKAFVYVYAQNGICAKIKIVVR